MEELRGKHKSRESLSDLKYIGSYQTPSNHYVPYVLFRFSHSFWNRTIFFVLDIDHAEQELQLNQQEQM